MRAKPFMFQIDCVLKQWKDRSAGKRCTVIEPSIAMKRLLDAGDRHDVTFEQVDLNRSVAAGAHGPKNASGSRRRSFTNIWSFAGRLSATNPEKFQALLANGIGDMRYLGLGFLNVWQSPQ